MSIVDSRRVTRHDDHPRPARRLVASGRQGAIENNPILSTDCSCLQVRWGRERPAWRRSDALSIHVCERRICVCDLPADPCKEVSMACESRHDVANVSPVSPIRLSAPLIPLSSERPGRHADLAMEEIHEVRRTTESAALRNLLAREICFR